jgi:hypothetical protein
MKKDEVPADKGYLDDFCRGAYAVDEHGRYTLVATPGWEAETAATRVALEEQDRLVRAQFEAARAGRRSPLAYHLARRMLTPSVLGQYARVNRFRVAWHLRPFGFARMPLWLAMRYCQALRIGLDELVHLPAEPESLL